MDIVYPGIPGNTRNLYWGWFMIPVAKVQDCPLRFPKSEKVTRGPHIHN